MPFQKCPVCNGSGRSGNSVFGNGYCSACNGSGMIDDQFGTPGFKTITTAGTQSDKPMEDFPWTDALVTQLLDDYHQSSRPTENIIANFKHNKRLTSAKEINERLSTQSINNSLFTTEDGKEIFDGDEQVFTVGKSLVMDSKFADIAKHLHDEVKIFSTIESAKQFIRENEPSISWRQLVEFAKTQIPEEDQLSFKAGLVYNGFSLIRVKSLLARFKPKP